MRISNIIFLVCSLHLYTLSLGDVELSGRGVRVRNLGEESDHPQKPPPNGGGGSSGSGSSTSSANGQSSGTSSGGQSSGGGSSSGSSSGTSQGSNSGSSSSGSSSSTSSAGGSRNRASQHNVESVSDIRSNIGVIIGLVGAATLVSAVIVATSLRRTAVKVAHPLKGSINRRMNLFNDMANHNPAAARPPRRAEDVYIPAPGGVAGV